MKRTAIVFSPLVLFLSLTFVSCDQMFSNNLFAGLTQKKLSASSVAAMTPEEIVSMTSSTNAMGQLSDPATKAAALEALLPAYDTPAEQATVPGQAAAIAAADISIETVPEAAQFASAAVSLVINSSDIFKSAASATDIADALTGILPSDIASQLASSTAPPVEFTTMIDAFVGAYSSYQALSAGVTASGGAGSPAYADPSIGPSQKTEIAVNATIAGLLSAVVPATGGSSSASVAAALWSSLRDPKNADSFLSFGSIDDITGPTGTVGGLFAAANLL